jgi:RimJ/RimL family protein N-acetyltransferase
MHRSSPAVIRLLDPDDADAWAALRHEALIAHPLAFGASAPENPDDLVAVARERLAPSGDAVVFGALVDDRLVGTVGIRRQPGLKERHKGLIWGMYVSDAARRSGVGAALVKAALEHAGRMPGIVQVHLAVSEVAIEAQSLYARYGFRAWGREPRALCHEGRFIGELHMVVMLDEDSAKR